MVKAVNSIALKCHYVLVWRGFFFSFQDITLSSASSVQTLLPRGKSYYVHNYVTSDPLTYKLALMGICLTFSVAVPHWIMHKYWPKCIHCVPGVIYQHISVPTKAQCRIAYRDILRGLRMYAGYVRLRSLWRNRLSLGCVNRTVPVSTGNTTTRFDRRGWRPE